MSTQFDTAQLHEDLRHAYPQTQVQSVDDLEFWAAAQLAKKQIEQSIATVKPRLKKSRARNVEWVKWICNTVGGLR